VNAYVDDQHQHEFDLWKGLFDFLGKMLRVTDAQGTIVAGFAGVKLGRKSLLEYTEPAPIAKAIDYDFVDQMRF
jgi:hypothetical protein